jgi:hypothetical protein
VSAPLFSSVLFSSLLFSHARYISNPPHLHWHDHSN